MISTYPNHTEYVPNDSGENIFASARLPIIGINCAIAVPDKTRPIFNQ